LFAIFDPPFPNYTGGPFLWGRTTTITILDIGRMHDGVKYQAYRVDKDVALLTLDLLPRVVARRIDAGPPFSAPFTL
jgi:hypothetical protein